MAEFTIKPEYSYATAKIHQEVQRAQWTQAIIGATLTTDASVPVYARPDGTVSAQCTPGSVLAGTAVYPSRASDVRTYLATKPVRAGEVATLGGNVKPVTEPVPVLSCGEVALPCEVSPMSPEPEMKAKHIEVRLPGYVDKIEATIGIVAPKPCDGCGAPSERSKGGGFTHCTHRDDCPHVLAAAREERRAREAPLVAFVNAVPDGLDPVGWHAAVLAVNDAPAYWRSGKSDKPWDVVALWAKHDITGALRRVAAGETWWAGKIEIHKVATDAYARAIAPHKAPPPERKGATWRERGALYTQHADDAEV